MTFTRSAKEAKNQTAKTTYNTSPRTHTSSGIIEGFYEDNIAKFYGIPFAKPPVGELRFTPPQDVTPWKGILQCKKKKAAALQLEGISGDREFSEDCLYLNLWAPREAQIKKKLPVLVFIHGGGFMQGSPNTSIFDGTVFAQEGVIQVNLAYRLNALGFTAFKEIEEEYGYLGNAGLLDLIKGLKWVNDNIEAFGGDINNITICGESAGSMLISNIVIAKEAENLFSKAIMESGTSLVQHVLAPGGSGDRFEAIESTKRLMSTVGAANIDDMRRIDGMKLVENSIFSFNMTKQNPHYFFPIFDGELIPFNPVEAVNAGNLGKIDILTGFNVDEGTIFIPSNITETDYDNYINRAFGDDADIIMKRFPVDKNHSMVDRLRYIVKLCLVSGSQTYADIITAKGQNAYLYKFSYATESLKKNGMGTYHGFELPFVFDNLSADLQDEETIKVKDHIHKRWLGFIKSGNPNDNDAVSLQWPVYTKQDREMMVIDKNLSTDTWPFTEDLEFLINNTDYPYLKNR